MSDIEEKALALLNEVLAERVHWQMTGTRTDNASIEALCRAIEQHEAFRREVSDIVEAYVNATNVDDWEKLKALIIPKPKPDPLVEAIREMALSDADQRDADQLRAALDARGFEIVEVER